jgi:ABC-type glutathione transport system ATPase component
MAEELKIEERVCRSPGEATLQIRDVHKSFGKNHVLRGVNLEVKCGQTMVVIGGSGTGKSVLLKCIIGLLHHDRGEILVDGQEISRLKERDWNQLLRKFGMVFQRDALFDSITIWENVGFGLRQHTPLTDDEIKGIAVEKLKLVGLQNIEDRLALRGDAQTGEPGPGYCHGAFHHPLRRAHHRPGPGHGQRDQRADGADEGETGCDLDRHHP